jgi:hypothetical protein
MPDKNNPDKHIDLFLQGITLIGDFPESGTEIFNAFF